MKKAMINKARTIKIVTDIKGILVKYGYANVRRKLKDRNP